MVDSHHCVHYMIVVLVWVGSLSGLFTSHSVMYVEVRGVCGPCKPVFKGHSDEKTFSWSGLLKTAFTGYACILGEHGLG